jgi:antitoxin (DNA-binding transcriptional repressor) of toxin-antitoxin stability system
MAKTISATDAARKFSDILNHIVRGERYTIARGGKPIAALGPVGAAATKLTLAEAVELLKELPSLGKDVDGFARTVRQAIRRAPRPPKRSPWA